MSRKLIGREPLTNAEKQRRFREKQKAQGKKRAWTDTAPDIAALREAIKAELRKTWEPELKAARIEAERKEGRKLARQASQIHAGGRVTGLCQAADFFTGMDRADISRALLQHFMIDRETAAAVLEADKRTRSVTLASLDKSGTWKKPPKVIK
jgi:hypothetical protein